MLMEWVKNNLSITNLVMVGMGVFGLGTYYMGTEMRAAVQMEQLKEAKQEIKELKQKIETTENAASQIGWKVDRLIIDVDEIKNDVKATRKAVQ